ncbi:MAG: ABC transporter permease [Saccharofermentanales bacterium]|jgi:peptide/nickel transport system permease protein
MSKKKSKKPIPKTLTRRTPWQDAMFRFRQDKLAMAGLWILVAILLITILGAIFLDYDTQVIEQNVRNKYAPPSAEHWFGTDGFGRDIFARVVWGSRYSLLIGFAATFSSLFIGGFLGAIAGYYGGKIDNVIMRIMDMFIAIPTILLAIAIVSALGPSLLNLIMAICISNVPGYARLIRSSVLTIKDNDFVEAARATGASNRKIIMTHILPNTLAPIIVQATLGVGYAISSASGLSFLGLGIMPPDPEWGNMLAEGQDVIRYTPWPVIFPGLAIMITVLALNLVGDGLRDSIDPKLKR